MQVYLIEQREEDVPESNDWLAERERNHVRTLTFLKRRADWRLGRWAAKCAIASLQRVMRRDAQSAKEQQEVDTTLPPLVVSR